MTGSSFNQTGGLFGNFSQNQNNVNPNALISNAANSIFNTNLTSNLANNLSPQASNIGGQGAIFGGNNNSNNQMFGFNQANNNTSNSPIFGGQSAFNNNNFNTGTMVNGQLVTNNPNTPAFGFGSNSNFPQSQNTSSFLSNNQASYFNQTKKFTPVRSKNTAKLDQKHLVKCIALLDQNTGFCKKQLRIRHLTGATSNNFGSNPNNISFGVNNGNGGVPTSSFGFGANQQQQTNPLSFGSSQTSNIFGQTNPSSNFTGGTNNQNNFLSKPPILGGATNNQFSFSSPQNLQQPQQQFSYKSITNEIFGNKNNNNTFNNTFNTNNTASSNFYASQNSSILQTPNTNVSPFQTQNSFNQQNQFGNQFQQPNLMNPQQQRNISNQIYSNLSQNLFPNMPTLASQQPQTGIFAPINNQSITIFPPNTLNNNNNTTALLNNAALTLLNSSTNNVQNNGNQQQYGNTPIFGAQSQPYVNPVYNLMTNYFTNPVFQQIFLNSLINSDMFKNIEQQKRNKLYNKLRTDMKSKKQFNQKLFIYNEQQQMERKQREQEQALQSFKKIRRSVQSTRQPYIFYKSQRSDNFQPIFASINNKVSNKNKQKYGFQPKQIPKIKSSTLKKNNNLNDDIFILKKTPFQQFQQNYDRFHHLVLQQIKTKPQQRPVNDMKFKITPNLDGLQDMTPNQLTKVRNVSIQNEFGKVIFKQPINLYRKVLSECIQISQDEIHLKDDWEGKRCLLIYKNFSDFINRNQQQKIKIKRKIIKWAAKNNLRSHNIDQKTGNLTVQLVP